MTDNGGKMSSMKTAGSTALLLVMLAAQAGAQQAPAPAVPQPRMPAEAAGLPGGVPVPGVPTPYYSGGMITGGSGDGSVQATRDPAQALQIQLPPSGGVMPPSAAQAGQAPMPPQGQGMGTLPQVAPGYPVPVQAYPQAPGYPQGYVQLPPVVPPGQGGLPPIIDPNQLTAEQIEAYNEAIRQVFPMTPELIRLYMQTARSTQEAILERPQPQPVTETSFIRLEPGEEPPALSVAEGIATALNFYDSTGQPWPISMYVLGNEKFQAIQLGKGSNSLTLSPLVPVGWGNIVVTLEGLNQPVSISLSVSDTTVDSSRNIQIMEPGPNAVVPPPPPPRGQPVAGEAGNRMMMKVVEGVDIPEEATSVPVGGVDAKAWLLGEELYVRSRHRLSTQFHEQMAGPGGFNAYRLKRTPLLMFIVDGRVVAANVTLP